MFFRTRNNSLYFFLHIEIIKVICPECNVELDPTVHLFCYRCGKKVDKIVSIAQKKQGKDACVQYDLHMCIVCLEQSCISARLCTVVRCAILFILLI